jgi:hypothetical protein
MRTKRINADADKRDKMRMRTKRIKCGLFPTSFPGLQWEDEGRDEEALVWAGQFCILIGKHHIYCLKVTELDS